MSHSRKKVVLFFANYGPYHLYRLKGFCKLANDLDWQVFPIELTRSGIAYEWKTKVKNTKPSIHSILGDKDPSQVSFPHLVLSLYRTLNKSQPDVIAIAGYFRPAMLATLAWSKYFKVPAILLSESKEDDAKRRWLIEKVKSQVLSHFTSALVGGQTHKRYLIKLGMPHDAIFFGYNVVGNESFLYEKSLEIKHAIESPYFLAINRFIPKKNLLFLLKSYAKYREKSVNNPWDLVLCGDGQLLPDITKLLDRLCLKKCVHLPGFLQHEQLLPYFAHANCFVHASFQEQWGLVVNEAMAAGLPVLVSNRCGCYEELVIEGVNGFGFAPDNQQQLIDLMLKLSSDAVDLQAMGHASLKHISKFSPDYFGQGLKKSIDYALTHY